MRSVRIAVRVMDFGRRTRIEHRARWCVLLAVIGFGLNACGGDDEPPATPTAAPVLVTATLAVFIPTGSASIGEIVWALRVDPATKEPIEVVDRFADTAETIFAAAPVANLGPGVVLRVEWSYNKTSLNGLGSDIVDSRGLADGWVEFHLSKPSDSTWPAGRYEVTLYVDGAPIRSGGVDVG